MSEFYVCILKNKDTLTKTISNFDALIFGVDKWELLRCYMAWIYQYAILPWVLYPILNIGCFFVFSGYKKFLLL